MRAADDPTNPRLGRPAGQPAAPARVPSDAEVLAYIRSQPQHIGGVRWMLSNGDPAGAMRYARHEMTRGDMGRQAAAAPDMRPEAYGLPRGTDPATVAAYRDKAVRDKSPPAADPMIADAGPEFYAAWQELRAKYPTWTREQLFRAASAAMQQRGAADQEAYRRMVPEPQPQRPPQDTDPIRKLMEDARKQMDLQDRMRDAQKQIQLEALQREAMRGGESVMWKDNKPFLPSQNSQAAQQVSAERTQKQIADQQEAYRKQQEEADRLRKNRNPAFNPGMAQPIPPPSEGEQYGKTTGYGEWVGQPDGPNTTDFRDQDADGIDDRRQLGPGQPAHRPRIGQIAKPGPEGIRYQF